MEILPPLEVKDLGACEPGELIRYGADGAGKLGVVARRTEGGMLVFLLDADVKDIRFWTDSVDAYDGRCTSYGTEWCLELLDGPETWPGNPAHVDTLGVIRQTPGSTCIVGLQADGKSLWLFDVVNLKPSNRQRYEGALISKWKIWRSRDDAARMDARPILEFPPE